MDWDLCPYWLHYNFINIMNTVNVKVQWIDFLWERPHWENLHWVNSQWIDTHWIAIRVVREIHRLQELNNWKDVLAPSGKSINDIIRMNLDIVDKHIRNWWWVDFDYNIPWLTQVALKKWVTSRDLRIDNPSEILYPAQPNINLPITQSNIINTMVSLMPDEWFFNWFVRNINEVCEVFSALQESVSSKRDILILSNHATWFNLPLIAHCLNRVLHVPQQSIYTILWPVIPHSHWTMAGILRYSNALKTHPDTPKAATGHPGSKKIREDFLREIDSTFNVKTTTERASRILLLSPSGTTDKITSDGRITMSQPSKGTGWLIKLLLKRFNMIGFAIGVNDTPIIQPWHSRPRKWDAFLKIAPIDSVNWKQVMPETIRDACWNNIWTWDENK